MVAGLSTAFAGLLGGALMGLIFLTHVALLLVFRPPEALTRRASTTGVAGLVLAGSGLGVLVWSLLGVGAAFLFRTIERGGGSSLPTVPSVPYLLMVLFVTALTAIPASLVLRDRLRHVAVEYALFIGIFGWMIPALVKAV